MSSVYKMFIRKGLSTVSFLRWKAILKYYDLNFHFTFHISQIKCYWQSSDFDEILKPMVTTVSKNHSLFYHSDSEERNVLRNEITESFKH